MQSHEDMVQIDQINNQATEEGWSEERRAAVVRQLLKSHELESEEDDMDFEDAVEDGVIDEGLQAK